MLVKFLRSGTKRNSCYLNLSVYRLFGSEPRRISRTGCDSSSNEVGVSRKSLARSQNHLVDAISKPAGSSNADRSSCRKAEGYFYLPGKSCPHSPPGLLSFLILKLNAGSRTIQDDPRKSHLCSYTAAFPNAGLTMGHSRFRCSV